MKRRGMFWAVLLAAGLFVLRAAAAELTLSPEVYDGFSRVEFRWEFPTEYKIRQKDDRLEISFSRPVDQDVSSIPRRLRDSVRSAELSRDRRTLVMRLSRPFVVRDFSTENDVVLDLLGANDPKNAPPGGAAPAPASPAVRSRPASPLRLFAVQRRGLDQIVFSWDKPVPFTETNGKGTYELSFDSPVSPRVVDMTQVVAVLPARLQNWHLSSSGGKLLLSGSVPEGYRVWAEKKGRQVYLNFAASSADAPAAPEKPAKPAPVPVVRPAVLPPALPASKSENAEARQNAALSGLIPYSADQESVQLVNVSEPEGFSRTSSSAASGPSPSSGYRVVSLSFSWPRMTAAAAFRRDGYLWVVFDRKEEFHFDTELALNKDIIYEMIQIPHSHATILRFVTAEGYNPSFRREGLLWIMDLMYQPLRPRHNVDLVLQRKTPFGPRIFIPLEETPHVIPLIDPEVGDLMYIIPVFSLSRGVPQKRDFVDAAFLPTSQGVVVIPNIEDLSVYASTSGIEVRGPKGGMRFSSEDILSFLAKTRAAKDPLSQLLDVGVWAGASTASYADALAELQEEAAFASKPDRPLKRLALARYYFANGMYPETLGVLRVLTADDPDFNKQPAVVALRGAANFMMMRYSEAMTDFTSPLLSGKAAVDFWRAATLSATSRTPEKYLAPLKNNMGILQAYPRPIKTRLALAGLHAAVAAGDEFAIQNFMEAAYSADNSTMESSEITFYHALWQENSGMYNQAVKEMSVLADGTDYYFRAMGGLEKIRMETKLETITPEKRIEELEKLMYAWRGDEFEYNLMTMLVAAYQDQKDYAKVLHLLKDMKIRFRDMPESRRIAPLMEDIFQQLYLDDDKELISPIKAIALYNEFSDLTPSGEKGARIVRRLADRLVAIDLLEPAAGLLEDQLKRPVGKEEKGLIGTRLALVRLLNKEPEKALKALENSAKNEFSDKVQAQRRYIKAKALADLNKTGEAAALLEGDDSEEGKRLLAEIYWQAQEWDKAADALKRLISRPQPGVPLSPLEAQRVLDWATALRLAGRAKVVIRLRENFLPYMKETALAEPFDFITQSPQSGMLDYRTISKEIESAENFQTFARDYIGRLRTQGLSGAVQ